MRFCGGCFHNIGNECMYHGNIISEPFMESCGEHIDQVECVICRSYLEDTNIKYYHHEGGRICKKCSSIVYE